MFDADGYPRWVTIELDAWKAKVNMRYKMFLHRNYADPRFCLVRTLFDWLVISGVRKGPLLPRLTNNYRSVKEAVGLLPAADKSQLRGMKNAKLWIDSNGGMVNLSVRMLRSTMNEIFETSVIYKTLTVHSMRKISIKWMARCGLSTEQMKAISRHSENSSSWYRYIQDGIIDGIDCSTGDDACMRTP